MTKTVADLKAEKKAIMKELTAGDKAMNKIDRAANKLWIKVYALEDKIANSKPKLGVKAKKTPTKTGVRSPTYDGCGGKVAW